MKQHIFKLKCLINNFNFYIYLLMCSLKSLLKSINKITCKFHIKKRLQIIEWFFKNCYKIWPICRVFWEHRFQFIFAPISANLKLLIFYFIKFFSFLLLWNANICEFQFVKSLIIEIHWRTVQKSYIFLKMVKSKMFVIKRGKNLQFHNSSVISYPFKLL